MTADERLPESNWRPMPTASLAAVLVAVLVTGGLAVAVGAGLAGAIGLLAGGCLAGAVWTTAVSERRVAALGGSALAAASGLGVLAAVLRAVAVQTAWPPVPPVPYLEIAPFVAVASGIVTGFGAPAALWGLTPTDDAGRAGRRTVVVGLVPSVALGASLGAVPWERLRAVAGIAAELLLARGVAAGPALQVPQLGGLFLLGGVTALALRVALGVVPVVELAGEASVQTAEAVVGRLRFALGFVAVAGGGLGVVTALAGGAVGALLSAAPPPTGDLLLSLGVSTAVRAGLAGTVLACCGVVLAVRSVRAAASSEFRPGSVPVAASAGGLGLVGAAWVGHPRVQSLAVETASTESGRRFLLRAFESIGSLSVTLGAVAVCVLAAALLLLSVRMAGALRFVGELAGVQFAAAGVLLGAIGAGIAGVDPLVVAGGVAASLLVWDLGEFGATLGGEIGRLGRTRRGELVHVAGGTILAGAAVLVTAGVRAGIAALPTAPGAPAVVVTAAAAVGIVALFVVLR
jgi:hypothetical protein